MTNAMMVGKYKLIFSDTHFKDFRKKPTISVYDADTNSETKIASFNSQETFEWFIEAVVEADRKTENSSEKPNNCEDEQMETQTETQNSNLTFEKAMEEIQTQVIEFPDTHQKFTFARKIEMDGDSIKIGDWEYKGAKKKG